MNLYEDLVKKMLEVQQIMRHDFLNHIQVIYGFLQIGYSEKAKEYSLRAVDSMQHYTRLGKIPLPFLQCFLTWLVAQLNNEQASLEYTLNGDLKPWLEDDEELTRMIMLLICSVQDDLLNKKLKCRLVFEEKSSGFRIFFEGTAESIDHLKKIDLSSQKLLPVVDEDLPEKLTVTINKIIKATEKNECL